MSHYKLGLKRFVKNLKKKPHLTILRILALNLIILALALNNIDSVKTAGKNFVAATLGATSPACTDADDGASLGLTSPCCTLSCGCISGGSGCSKCCPAPGEDQTKTYYCDANDLSFGQCFFCKTCGGTGAKCNSQETGNECEADCGADASCDDKLVNVLICIGNIDTGGYCSAECVLSDADNKCEADCTGYTGIAECDEQSPDANISYCNKGGNLFIADSCSATCGGQDRVENICRSSGSLGTGDGCTAEAACNGLTRNSCNNKLVYCDENCASSSGLGADSDGDGTDDGCEEECNNKDDDGDGEIDEDLTRACQDFTLGVCTASTQVCAAGVWGTCLAKTSEFCGDSLDNDCDGKTDCLDSDCTGQQGSGGVTCCVSNSTCDSFDSACVYAGCVDDNTKSGYSVDGFCGDSGFCIYNNISCPIDCTNNGCCYANASQGVAVCSNEKDILNVDGEAKKEICCAGDWKGANCAGLTCTSTDSIEHDCCSFSECPADMITGDCGVAGCNNYACTVNQSISKCTETAVPGSECGISAGNCTATSQGWYDSYTCNYNGDNTQCGENNNYCKCIGNLCTCENACTDLCVDDCEYCYGTCSVYATDTDPNTVPNNINSCMSHGCWSECVT